VRAYSSPDWPFLKCHFLNVRFGGLSHKALKTFCLSCRRVSCLRRTVIALHYIKKWRFPFQAFTGILFCFLSSSFFASSYPRGDSSRWLWQAVLLLVQLVQILFGAVELCFKGEQLCHTPFLKKVPPRSFYLFINLLFSLQSIYVFFKSIDNCQLLQIELSLERCTSTQNISILLISIFKYCPIY